MRKLAGSTALILAIAGCSGSTGETTTSAAAADTLSPAATTTTTPPETTTTTTTPPETTTTTPTSEYVLFDGSADGFMIALPPRWVPLDPATADVGLDEVESLFDPEALEFASQSLAAAGGASLFAVDVFGTLNVTVIQTPLGRLDTLENLEAIVPAQIEEIGATVLSVDRGDYGGVEGLRSIYELPVPGVPFPAAGEQYYVLSEDTAYIITFTSFDPDPPRETFAAVMDTFMLIADFRQPTAYGDDPELDALYDECAAGAGAACDQLSLVSVTGSEYYSFGVTCGGRSAEFEFLFCENNI